jgi:hypothetical protein
MPQKWHPQQFPFFYSFVEQLFITGYKQHSPFQIILNFNPCSGRIVIFQCKHKPDFDCTWSVHLLLVYTGTGANTKNTVKMSNCLKVANLYYL